MNQENKFLIFVTLVFGISSVVIQSLIVPMIEVNLWRPDIVLVIVLLSGKRFGSAKGTPASLQLAKLMATITISIIPAIAFNHFLIFGFLLVNDKTSWNIIPPKLSFEREFAVHPSTKCSPNEHTG